MTSFEFVVNVYNKLEKTSATLEKIDILKELFKSVEPEEIDKLIYLTQGILYPNYVPEPPIGIAEKVAIKAISKMSNLSEQLIKKIIDESGGIGNAITKIFKQKKSKKTLDLFMKKYDVLDKKKDEKKTQSIIDIYNTLYDIAHQEGQGSTLRKIDLLAGLLSKSTEKEAKYILRIILGTLRLGIADMTIINALSVAFTGTKDNKEFIEEKYNILPDLGKIGKILAEEGLDGIKKIDVEVGIPIKMMLAQRAKSIENRFACEYKYDGERVQAHKNGSNILLFSRNIENITHMYPDIIESIKKIPVNKLIFEGEIVAIDPKTGRIKPFQELMRRRRKYDIDIIMKEYPVELYLFDILYKDGEVLLKTPYIKRREILEKITKYDELKNDPIIKIANQKIVNSEEELIQFFEEALDQCEGLMIKSIKEDSIYQAGS
ncbi:MAG: ATP-dependent DNA ligase, partial [Candidatus Helarchaeota archaeon]